MALSQSTVLAQIRDLVAGVTGMVRVYAAGETDANAIPASIQEWPAALILPGPTTEYILMGGGQRHSYDVKVQVLQAGGDIGSRVTDVLPFVDRIISKFESNVTLGNRANSCLFAGSSGLQGMEYNGKEYTGYEITLRVSEQATATPATGS